jgi:hypothetical protein
VAGLNNVSDFDQTERCQWAQAQDVECKTSPKHEGVEMTEASQFRQYAEEAMRGADQSTTEKDKNALIELARTWMQGATASERSVGADDGPTDPPRLLAS